jgi:hypothetical protein
MNGTSKILDFMQDTAIAAAGIIGIDQAPQLLDSGAKISSAAASGGGSPDWIEPLLQGLIAVITIIAQFFKNRPPKRKRDQQ